MKSHTKISFALLVGVLAAIAIWAVFLSSSPKENARPAATGKAARQLPVAPNAHSDLGVADVKRELSAKTESRHAPRSHIYTTDFASIVREIRGVSLTDEQLAKMLDVYASVYEERQLFEASIATAVDLPDGSRAISIPAYRARGEELMDAIAFAYEEILGEQTAREVLKQVGLLIRGRNEEFGRYPQVYIVSHEPDRGFYELTHSLNPDANTGFRAEGYTKILDASVATSQWAPFSHLFPRRK